MSVAGVGVGARHQFRLDARYSADGAQQARVHVGQRSAKFVVRRAEDDFIVFVEHVRLESRISLSKTIIRA